MWDWYKRGGINNVAAYLAELDISQFNAKAPPPRTASFWTIVDAGGAPEDAEFADAIDALAKEKEGEPLGALTLDDIIGAAKSTDFKEWVADRKNRRQIPHRMEACGYVPVRNANIEDGRWRIAGKRVMIYALKTLSLREQQQAAHGRVKKGPGMRMMMMMAHYDCRSAAQGGTDTTEKIDSGRGGRGFVSLLIRLPL